MTASVEKSGTGVVGVVGVDWRSIQRRVASGTATASDAEPVRSIGLLPQALRIESGLANYHDALLIALQVELRHGEAPA